jgi:hypothetical protein
MLEARRAGSPAGSAATIAKDSGDAEWAKTTRDACSWALVGAGAGALMGARGMRAVQFGPEQGWPGSSGMPGSDFAAAGFIVPCVR